MGLFVEEMSGTYIISNFSAFFRVFNLKFKPGSLC